MLVEQLDEIENAKLYHPMSQNAPNIFIIREDQLNIHVRDGTM